MNALSSIRAHPRGRSELGPIVVFFAAHVPLALLMDRFSQVATLHALIVIAFGLWWSRFGRRLERVAYIGAYLTGAEVLWRMTEAQLPWEFSKYAVTTFFIIAILRTRRLRAPGLPILYFTLLLPSVALTVMSLTLAEARQQISFNLSGPLALMIGAWFFSGLKLSVAQLHRLFSVVIAPVIGIASVALLSTLTSAELRFGTGANFATSGGFGPNQVSAVLGLGALLALFNILNDRASWGIRALMFSMMVLLASQSALTFSRGGLYNAGGAIILASLFLLRDTRARVMLTLVVTLLLVVGYYLILPRIDAFTGGTLSDRFQDTSLTGRDLIVQADLQIWLENPLLGVGPGLSPPLHELFFRESASHTEFSRLLAEHGIFGLAAMLLLLVMIARNLKRARTAKGKAVVASMIGWSTLFMCVDAMRLMAPAFALALTFATILPEEMPALKLIRNYRYKSPDGQRPRRLQRAALKDVKM